MMFRVMIVDDEPKIRQGMENIIKREMHDFEVVGAAEDGIEALDLYEKVKPDLVIADIRMPGMDGLELSRILKAKDPGLNIIIVSGYSDFEYARKAIKYGVNDYILKPVDIGEFGKILSATAERITAANGEFIRKSEEREALRDYFFRKLVTDEMAENAFDHALEFGIDLAADHYGVSLMEVVQEKNSPVQMLQTIQAALESNSEAKKSGVGVFTFRDIKNRIGMVFAVSGSKALNWLVPEQAAILKNVLESACAGLRIYVGIGSTVNDVYDISHAYNTAVIALESCLLLGLSKILCYDDIRDKSEHAYLQWDEANLLEAIRQCDEDSICKEIDVLFYEVEKNILPVFLLKSIIANVYIRLSKIIYDHGDNSSNVIPKLHQFVKSSGKSFSISQVRDAFLDACLKTCGYIRQTLGSMNEGQIKKVLGYIERNYDRDLKLKDIATQFYMNYTYLGQLFKKKTGVLFNEYVNKVRIENAKRLILEENLPTSVIAEKVGYKFADHFYRNFKKFTGMNPGEYKLLSGK